MILTVALAAALVGSAAVPFEPATFAPNTFAEDVVIAPDGGTLFLTRAATNDSKERSIVMLERNASGWSAPQIAPFSGQWRDLEEVLSPDGREMIFASNRPATDGAHAIDGFFGGKVQPERGGNLWSVRWNGTAWGTPQRLPDAVNSNTSVFSPAITQDGTLYFMRSALPGPKFHLYVSKLDNGAYRSSQPAPFGDTHYSDVDPAVAPDGSFVIFASNRPPAPAGGSDLFIAFQHDGTWSTPIDMGSTIDPNHDAIEPRLSPDAKTLYFLSQGTLWSADISPWLAPSGALPKAAPFAGAILSDALSPSFFPGETTMLFTRMTGTNATIMQSQRSAGGWSTPVVSPFSGSWKDMDPAVAPDGSYVVFASTRPNGSAAGTSLLWRTNRTAGGWSTPVLLPTAVNVGVNIFSPSIAADGTLYFLQSTPVTHRHQLYRSRLIEGNYRQAEPLGFSTPATNDYDPATSPDQSFIVFASAGRKPHDRKRHLYIVRARDNGWSSVQPLSYAGDGGTDDSSPTIAPDGKTLYFTSTENAKSQVLEMTVTGEPTPR